MQEHLTFLDMFAGIGGFHSGMEKAGHKCVGWIEWDKFARQSYEAMYDTKGLFTANDIQQVRGRDLPDADAWCFGSPCQNISVAGNQQGLRGSKSSMFFEVIRLLEEKIENEQTLPAYLLMENVKNLLSSNNGWDFARVQIEMDKAGYDVEWNVFNSAEVVPQNRERIYIVGHLRTASTRRIFPIIRQSEATSSQSKIKQVGNYLNTKAFGGNPQVGRVYSPAGVSPTLNTMQGGGREPKILLEHSRIRKLTPLECWRLQGFEDEQFYKAKEVGVSNSQLYKQAGNAVTVPVVEAIAKKMQINE